MTIVQGSNNKKKSISFNANTNTEKKHVIYDKVKKVFHEYNCSRGSAAF